MREALLMVDGKKENRKDKLWVQQNQRGTITLPVKINNNVRVAFGLLGQRRSVALSHGAPRARRRTLRLIVIQVMHKGWG